MISKKEQRALTRFKEILTQKFGSRITHLRLFGSKARGDDRPDSDIDVLVVTQEDDWKLKEEIGKVATFILLEEGVYLSLKVFGEKSYDRLTRLASPFLKNIAREGKAF